MEKKPIQQLFWLTIVLLLFVSCSPFTKVYSEEEPGVNLHKYHTFNWLDNDKVQEGNKGPEWLTANTQNHIRSAVEHQMERYGFKICTEKPDLMLHYHVVIENKVFYARDRTCETGGNIQFGRCNRLRATNYREGTLILDFIDTKSSNQVWRGVAVGVLDDIRPDEVQKRVEAAINVIFKKFPEKPIPVQVLP